MPPYASLMLHPHPVARHDRAGADGDLPGDDLVPAPGATARWPPRSRRPAWNCVGAARGGAPHKFALSNEPLRNQSSTFETAGWRATNPPNRASARFGRRKPGVGSDCWDGPATNWPWRSRLSGDMPPAFHRPRQPATGVALAREGAARWRLHALSRVDALPDRGVDHAARPPGGVGRRPRPPDHALLRNPAASGIRPHASRRPPNPWPQLALQRGRRDRRRARQGVWDRRDHNPHFVVRVRRIRRSQATRVALSCPTPRSQSSPRFAPSVRSHRRGSVQLRSPWVLRVRPLCRALGPDGGCS